MSAAASPWEGNPWEVLTQGQRWTAELLLRAMADGKAYPAHRYDSGELDIAGFREHCSAVPAIVSDWLQWSGAMDLDHDGQGGSLVFVTMGGSAHRRMAARRLLESLEGRA